MTPPQQCHGESESPMGCQCCWELFHKHVPAPHWMEWDEWLCSEHAAQAIEDGLVVGPMNDLSEKS